MVVRLRKDWFYRHAVWPLVAAMLPNFRLAHVHSSGEVSFEPTNVSRVLAGFQGRSQRSRAELERLYMELGAERMQRLQAAQQQREQGHSAAAGAGAGAAAGAAVGAAAGSAAGAAAGTAAPAAAGSAAPAAAGARSTADTGSTAGSSPSSP
ncbi:MAG: hypothetical protein ACK4F6_19535, partial [Hylemonella sp.]